MFASIARAAIPWLLKRAMKLGAKQFTKDAAQTHGVASRDYLYDHVGKPLKEAVSASGNELDDRSFEYAYACQSWALSDGTVDTLIDGIERAIGRGDLVTAQGVLSRLKTILKPRRIQAASGANPPKTE